MALQAAWTFIRKKFPGNFKIADESHAGSESDSAPATSRKGGVEVDFGTRRTASLGGVLL